MKRSGVSMEAYPLQERMSRYNVLWCNGNTLVFGTKVQGSSPCRTANR